MTWSAAHARLVMEQAFLIQQSILAAVAVVPFGLWRLWRGDFAQGWFDLGLAALLGVLAVLGTRGQHVRVINLLFALTYTLGSAWVVHSVGPTGLFWAFPAAVAVFFVVRSREAVGINLFGLGLNCTLILDEADAFLIATFVSCQLLVSVFVWMFAHRLRLDNKRLQAENTIDPLTQAGNRRHLDDTLANIVQSASPGPYSLLMLDIDYFKSVNDQLGHAAGDLCLARLSAEVRALMAPGQQWFRYGGEEFLLLVPQGTEAAAAWAETLRSRIAAAPLMREGTITVSIGVATHAPGENVHQWLRRTDDALYEAKNTGRNRVCVSRPAPA